MMKLTKEGLAFKTVAGKNIFKGLMMVTIFVVTFVIGSLILM